jgi:hypothetical protein
LKLRILIGAPGSRYVATDTAETESFNTGQDPPSANPLD